jgi:antirestriction protein
VDKIKKKGYKMGKKWAIANFKVIASIFLDVNRKMEKMATFNCGFTFI